jgi:hypothetical protein
MVFESNGCHALGGVLLQHTQVGHHLEKRGTVMVSESDGHNDDGAGDDSDDGGDVSLARGSVESLSAQVGVVKSDGYDVRESR